MQKNINAIIDEIDAHLHSSDKRYYSEFYVGVSKDAVKRLFDGLNRIRLTVSDSPRKYTDNTRTLLCE